MASAHIARSIRYQIPLECTLIYLFIHYSPGEYRALRQSHGLRPPLCGHPALCLQWHAGTGPSDCDSVKRRKELVAEGLAARHEIGSCAKLRSGAAAARVLAL
ncbi:hypothetical protein AAFF_G00424360 [Aldrovandia affinis]|uniref:Uncharacterized protein n=1 Tax=Aldrovandia affinis TaxID=143900 RepID=A0AAD7T6U2_9TELE|nr:hypothetical protein AAFF_G00424360 [Aldrovandia affinis]